MVELYGAPFVEMIDRMRLEYPRQGAIFDLPARRWWLPAEGGPALSVRFHGARAGTPVGPASGPQSQMAQNVVLAWLAGSRIIELKTVQINDALVIGRPCIDAANVGYNIEWSQELKVADSLDQYVQGAMLVHMLRAAPAVFGRPFGEVDFAGGTGDIVYDMSIGYDLAGIRSDKVRAFVEGMIDATPSVERLRRQIPRRLAALRDLDYPTALSRSVTLSTFHGCPADEIERICEFLLAEVGVHTIVKMNPPMLGQQRLEHLLHDVLGYRELTVNPSAYTSGLQFEESIAMCRRMTKLAAERGLSFGAKFSNTLEVLNHRQVFAASEKVMYMSGPPLHVLALALVEVFRQAAGPEVPISFSAGVDRKNTANVVACGIVPVTTCTDLLKVGGYGRLPAYLDDLTKAMQAVGAATIDDFILDARGQRAAAGGDVRQAGWLNTSLIVAETIADQRYTAAKNRAVPKRIDSHLVMFDCITCDKCVPVCPNDANFLYETPPVDVVYRNVEVRPDGSLVAIGDERRFVVERKEQIANFADFCNHCGNCDTFCPEWDGPYLQKPNFFGSRASFEAAAGHDGFLVEGEPGSFALAGRIGGVACRLEQVGDAAENRWVYDDGCVRLAVERGEARGIAAGGQPPAEVHVVDWGRFHALATLLAGITGGARVNQLSSRWFDTAE